MNKLRVALVVAVLFTSHCWLHAATPVTSSSEPQYFGAKRPGLLVPPVEPSTMSSSALTLSTTVVPYWPESCQVKIGEMNLNGVTTVIAIERLARVGKISVMIDPEISGKVNASFNNMTVSDAIETLARTHGLKCIWQGSVLRVFSYKNAPLETVMVPIGDNDIVRLKPLIEAVLTRGRGRFEVDPKMGVITITDREDVVQLIREAVRTKDMTRLERAGSAQSGKGVITAPR